jgi:drug/metabolite transporter (DMT)-like permease
MKNLFLYGLTVAIWGSTWYAITLQLNGIPTQVSVAYRFALATLFLFAWCRLRRLPMRFSGHDHFLLALLGVTLFSINYVLFYEAEKHLVSGGVAIIFCLLVVFNILNSRWFFGLKPRPRVIAGALLGLVGVLLTFWNELRTLNSGSESLWGIGLSLVATLSASFGNMISVKLQQRRVPVMPANAFGMFYGTIALLGYALISGARFGFDTSPAYVGSLIYWFLSHPGWSHRRRSSRLRIGPISDRRVEPIRGVRRVSS